MSKPASLHGVSLHAVALLVPAALFALAACSGDDRTTSAETTTVAVTAATTTTSTIAAPTSPTTAAPPGVLELHLADTPIGQILAEGQGMTVYLFLGDTDGKLGCATGCTDTWRPLLSQGTAPELGAGLAAQDFGTVARPDGTQQVTFHGHPLYVYRGDKVAGDTNGVGIADAWFPVNAEGNSITT